MQSKVQEQVSNKAINQIINKSPWERYSSFKSFGLTLEKPWSKLTRKSLTESLDNKSFHLNPISLVSPLTTFWENKSLKTNYESHGQETMNSFPELVSNFVPLPVLNQNLSKERMNLKKSLLGESVQSSSLDHLNQRHIRTSGEFLFLQFWRSVL